MLIRLLLQAPEPEKKDEQMQDAAADGNAAPETTANGGTEAKDTEPMETEAAAAKSAEVRHFYCRTKL